MRKVIISVVGRDRPGIIAAVSRLLFDREYNVENVSQTLLQNQFSGIFIVSVPDTAPLAELETALADRMTEMGLHVFVKELEPAPPDPVFADAVPLIVTTRGPDRKGLVARVTEVMAGHGVNVTNLQAVFRGGDDPDQNIMIYEVDVPAGADQSALFADLRGKADELSLEISIQHRNIFEAINRI